jgi:hypothetical protein
VNIIRDIGPTSGGRGVGAPALLDDVFDARAPAALAAIAAVSRAHVRGRTLPDPPEAGPGSRAWLATALRCVLCAVCHECAPCGVVCVS